MRIVYHVSRMDEGGVAFTNEARAQRVAKRLRETTGDEYYVEHLRVYDDDDDDDEAVDFILEMT